MRRRLLARGAELEAQVLQLTVQRPAAQRRAFGDAHHLLQRQHHLLQPVEARALARQTLLDVAQALRHLRGDALLDGGLGHGVEVGVLLLLLMLLLLLVELLREHLVLALELLQALQQRHAPSGRAAQLRVEPAIILRAEEGCHCEYRFSKMCSVAETVVYEPSGS